MSARKKLLSCFFLSEVLCFYRETEELGVMSRCLKCPHYERFMSEMEREEGEFFDEAHKIWKYGYPRRFDVS